MTDLKYRLDYKKAIYNSPEMPPSIIDLSVATCVAGNAQIARGLVAEHPEFRVHESDHGQRTVDGVQKHAGVFSGAYDTV